MANTLMFEVGVKQAVEGLDKVKRQLDEFVTDYGKKMQIQVDIKNLETFINALKSIGNGEHLKPLLQQIEHLQNRLASMSDKGKYFDFLKGEAAAAAEAVKIAEQQLERIKKSGNTNLIANARLTLDNAKMESARYNEQLASATSRLTKEEEKAVTTTTEVKGKIDSLSQSVEGLHTKLGSGLNINFGGDFAKWAQEVQAVTVSVRELVEQLQKMNNASPVQSTTEATKAQTQAVLEESEAYKQLVKWREQAEKFFATNKPIADTNTFIGHAVNGIVLGDKTSLETIKQHIYLQKDENKLLAERKLIEEQIARSNIRKYDQRESLKDVLGVYDKVLNALQQIKQTEQAPAAKGGLFDQQQFKTLQEAIDAVIREINRLKEAFAGIGEIKGMTQLTESMNILFHNVNTFKDMFSTLSSAVNLTPTSEYVKKLQTDFEAAQAKVQELTEKLTALTAAQNNVAESAAKAGKSEQQIGDSQTAMFNRYNKLLADIRNIKSEIIEIQRSTGGGGPFGEKLGEYFSSINRIRNLVREITSAPSVAEAIQRGMSSELLAKLNSALAALKTNYKEVISDAKSFNKATDKGSSQAEARIRKLGMAFNELKNYMKANGGSEEMRRLQSEIQGAIRKMRELMNAGNFAGAINVYERLSGIIRQAATATKEYERAQHQASSAVSLLTASEQQLANAIKGSTDSMRSQSQILSDLKSMAMQYVSVWGAQSFVNSIIETGGLLEQQRLSLSAILGDVEKANTLFGQVKELALKSPFGVVQIDKMTKQLAAYSFEYEDLFDWTKRLADISAATGTSVDRLALALGHVRSEGALSGYTLRQFAMANVPVLKMLSENLGISSKEVRERVRKKEIGAEDVQDILKQLTDEGGMFYNAQEVMSQALNAKFKNLRDAFDIMYGEIAESGVGDRLKELAVILTQGAKEWERFGKDILAVGAAFGIGRVAVLLYNTALGEGTAATLKNIAAIQQKENAHLRLARAAGLVTETEYKQLVFNERYSVSALKVAIVENKLTIEELQRAVALGKVNKAVAQAAVVSAGYNASLISNVKVLAGWRKGIFLVGEGFRAATLAVKGFLASAWPLLALSVVFDLVNRTSQNNDAAKDAADGAAKATNKYQDLQAMTERLGSSQKKTNDQLENNIKAMKESLTACGEYTEELKKQVESVETLAEKYDILLAAMKRVSDKASDKQDRKKNLIEEGLATGSGTAWAPWNWFRDNALKDAKDIDDYTQELYLVLDKNDKVLREGFKKILTTRKEWKDKFESMSAKDIFMSLGIKERDDVLYDLRWGKGMSKAMENAGYDLAEWYFGFSTSDREYNKYSYLGALNELKGHKEELAKAFADAFRVDHPEIDLSKADDEQKVVFAKWLDLTIANLEDVKESGKKALNDIVIEGTIGVRPKYSLDNENWEKFLEDFKEKNPLAYYEWNKHESTGGLTEENKRKSLESYGKTFSGMTDSTLGNTSKKQLKELKAERARLKAEQASAAYREELEVKKRVDNRLAEVDKEERRLKQAQKDFNQYGDPDKNKGRGEDKEAKALRERVRILKEAETSYQYWRKAVGDAASATHVEDEFGKILSEQNFSFENVEQYKKTLEELRAKYQGIYDTSEKAGKKRPQLLEAIKEIDKILADMGRKDFEKKTEEFLSKTQIELDGLTRSWEIFNSVREATGNIELAVQISGADYASGKTRNLADALKEKIQKDFKDAGGAGLFYFDVNLSDKQIKELIENGAPKTSKESAAEYEKRIAGIVDEYKKWRDLQRDVEQKDVETFNKLVSSAVDLQSELSKISDEYNRIIQSLDRMKTKGRITEKGYNQAKAIADADFQMKAIQARNEYKFLMDGVVTMNKKAAQIIRNEYINALQAKLKAGTITAKDYADKIQEINDKMRELENAPSYFQSYTQGGFQSFFENLMNRGKSYTQQGAALYQQGSKETVSIRSGGETLQMTNLSKMMQGEQMSKMGASMMQGAQSAMSTMAIIDAIIHGINDAVQSMKGIFDDVREMFKALGRDVDTDSWQDADTFFSTFSKASQQATNGWDSLKNGNVGGAIQGTVGSITSWFTGFAEGHDRKREKHIQDLKFEVTKISNTLDLIKSLRERTLGYDKGELRRLLANQYSNNYTDAGRDMYEYYSRGGLDGTGYQQEFNALKKQRELYQEMYDSEADKKDSSDEALEEYKNKMADLDQQIMFFAQDLANELFSIDIKGWADQISDSLMTAFENGEDAAKSFKDTVEDIMKDVVKRMLSVGVIQPMMAKLQKKLFGENGQGGSFDAMNPEGTIDAALRDIADFFGEGGEGTKAINAAQLFYDKTEAMMNSKGLTLSEKESSNSLSSNIKGITEQTADLLAAYLNAVRADVSVNRAMIAQYYPLFYAAMTGGNASLQNIENHTAAIMRSNDAINRNVEDLRSDFHGLKTGVWKMPIA